MTCNVWLYVWIVISLAGSVVIGHGTRAQDPNVPHGQIEIVVFPPATPHIRTAAR
jgi:hypothetical protein